MRSCVRSVPLRALCAVVVMSAVESVFFAGSAAAQHRTAVDIASEHGQVWKQHDITPYTAKVANTSLPQRAVLDWILLETGFEVWHSEIPAMLNVTHDQVRVYHTPEIQAQVESVVQRFVLTDPLAHQFRVRIFSVSSPHWRQKAVATWRPIPSASAGSQAWVLSPEDLSVAMEMFASEAGFQSLATDTKWVPNGQPMRIQLLRQRRYTRNFYVRPGSDRGPEPENVLFDDGFAFEVMPLLAVDGTYVDAQVKLQINHLDRFFPTSITWPGELGQNAARKVSVPVVGQCRFRERYSWNTDAALLVSVGITPPAVASGDGGGNFNLLNVTQRVETLIVIEYRRVENAL